MPVTQVTAVEPDFFRTMRIPLRQGRLLDGRDGIKSQRVFVVNEAFARKAFPDGDALGKRIIVRMGDTTPGEIVGIVGDIRYTALTEPVQPTVYYAHTQLYFAFMHLVVRTSVPPETLANGVTAAVHAVDRELPVGAVRPLSEVLADSIARSRFTTMLLDHLRGVRTCARGRRCVRRDGLQCVAADAGNRSSNGFRCTRARCHLACPASRGSASF